MTSCSLLSPREPESAKTDDSASSIAARIGTIEIDVSALGNGSGSQRARALDHLIETTILKRKALEMGLEPTDKELANRWTTEVLRFRGEEALRTYLKKKGQTEEEVRKRHREELRRGKITAAIKEASVLDEAEVRAYYDSHPDEFRVPERLRLRNILLLVPEGADDAVAEKARRKLLGFKRQLDEGKVTFEALAREHDQGRSRQQGGNLGWLMYEQIAEPLARAAWELKDGEISAPVRSNAGFHLVERVASQPETIRPFIEVKRGLRNVLSARYKTRRVRETLAEWREEAGVKILIPELELTEAVKASVEEDPSPRPDSASPVAETSQAPGGRHLPEALPEPIKVEKRPSRRRGHPGYRTGPPKM